MPGLLRTAAARITTRDLPDYLTDLFGHFEGAFARAEREVGVSVGGCRFVCRTDTAAASGTIRRGLADGGEAPEERTCRIVAGAAAALGLPPAPVWAEAFYRERMVEAALADTRFRLHHMVDLGFWQMYDPTPAAASSSSIPAAVCPRGTAARRCETFSTGTSPVPIAT